jgi:uncharacterized protein
MYHPSVLVTGASGFIGSYLVPYLLDQDYQVIGLSRQSNPTMKHPRLKWVQSFDQIQTSTIDYVINLAGESIGQGRWTEKRKQKLIASRVQTTLQLFSYLKHLSVPPKRIISGSAVGFYGIDESELWNKKLDETNHGQSIFMSELCQKWEQAALRLPTFDTKIIRLGVVFGYGGGILPQMITPIRFNLVGKIGSGWQPLAWIHVEDVLRAIEFLMLNDTQEKIFNVVSPENTTQLDFVQTASSILKKKPILTMPDWVFKTLLGEQSQLILNGQHVVPKALLNAGFEFKYPDLKTTLTKLLPTH